MRELIRRCPHERCSLELGRSIGERLRPGDVLTLWGPLGAGKTLLARGIARGLGVPAEVPVTSPSFTFINEYLGRLHLYHIDLYRLSDPGELDTLPWREALFGDGVAVIEWPDRLGPALPAERWDIRLEITGEESRTITIEACGEQAGERFAEWLEALPESVSS